MGIGEKHHHNHLNFHLHFLHLLHHNHHQIQQQQQSAAKKDVPKGCVAIMVGQGEEQQRFVVPVIYLNHPIFMNLLKEAEEEYGFDQKGAIAIPCHVEQFHNVHRIIDGQSSLQHHDHHLIHPSCFRA